MSQHVTDIAIIGAGPVGLFAVFECGMLGFKSVVVDALPDIGGQCSALYPEKPIYDIPAHPSISGGDLIVSLEKQAKPFAPAYLLNQQIVAISRENDKWRLKTSLGSEIMARAVIIAAGAGAFGPNRPPLDGIESFENTSVFYMVRRKADFAGKNIVIAGGGDSAVDWALSLSDVAKSIYVVHRRDKFRAAPESITQLKALESAGKVHIMVPYQLDSLLGTAPHLNGVVIRDEQGNTKTLAADILLPFFGLSADLGGIANWGLSLERQQITVDPFTCETNLPNIYAIGDIAAYKNKLKLILTGFAESATAAHAIYSKLNPSASLHMVHSTDKGVPK